MSGPERLDPLQAATTEAESLSTSIQAADRVAKVFLRPEESGWGVTRGASVRRALGGGGESVWDVIMHGFVLGGRCRSSARVRCLRGDLTREPGSEWDVRSSSTGAPRAGPRSRFRLRPTDRSAWRRAKVALHQSAGRGRLRQAVRRCDGWRKRSIRTRVITPPVPVRALHSAGSVALRRASSGSIFRPVEVRSRCSVAPATTVS